jgi:hypothetical protein
MLVKCKKILLGGIHRQAMMKAAQKAGRGKRWTGNSGQR